VELPFAFINRLSSSQNMLISPRNQQ